MSLSLVPSKAVSTSTAASSASLTSSSSRSSPEEVRFDWRGHTIENLAEIVQKEFAKLDKTVLPHQITFETSLNSLDFTRFKRIAPFLLKGTEVRFCDNNIIFLRMNDSRIVLQNQE